MVSSTILEALRRKVSCMEPGTTAVKSPSPIQYRRRLRPPSQSPPRPVPPRPVPAPLQAAQALRLPRALRNRPRPVVLVPIRLLPLVPMSLPRLLLEFLPKVCFRWVTLVDWCWLLGSLSDGYPEWIDGLVVATVSGSDRRLGSRITSRDQRRSFFLPPT